MEMSLLTFRLPAELANACLPAGGSCQTPAAQGLVHTRPYRETIAVVVYQCSSFNQYLNSNYWRELYNQRCVSLVSSLICVFISPTTKSVGSI